MSEPRGEIEPPDGAVLDAAFEMANADVLTAWRVRNAALAVAAAFVHPGPDWEDEQARKRIVEEWVSDGHEQVAEENRQRLVAIQRMIAAEAENEQLRDALELIDRFGCSTFCGGARCLDQGSGRIRGSGEGATSWCDACIARAALSGRGRGDD